MSRREKLLFPIFRNEAEHARFPQASAQCEQIRVLADPSRKVRFTIVKRKLEEFSYQYPAQHEPRGALQRLICSILPLSF